MEELWWKAEHILHWGRSVSRSAGWRTCLIDVEAWQKLVFSWWASSLSECDESWNIKVRHPEKLKLNAAKYGAPLNWPWGALIQKTDSEGPWETFKVSENPWKTLKMTSLPVLASCSFDYSQMLCLSAAVSFKSAVTDVTGRLMSWLADPSWGDNTALLIVMPPTTHVEHQALTHFPFLKLCTAVNNYNVELLQLELMRLSQLAAGPQLTLSSPVSAEHTVCRCSSPASWTMTPRDVGTLRQW